MGVFHLSLFTFIVFQVLLDVLWVCQHGLRFADFTANPKLETTIQILPLVRALLSFKVDAL